MTEKRFISEYVEIIDENGSRQAVCVTDKEHTVSFEVKDEYVAMELCGLLNEQQATITKLNEENEQLHHELQQIKEYLQIKIDECENHKKMKEIVFGVEQAVGYEKALLQFQKGLKRRLNDE